MKFKLYADSNKNTRMMLPISKAETYVEIIFKLFHSIIISICEIQVKKQSLNFDR